VIVTVSRRVPVAWAPAGRGRYAVIDAHGHVVAVNPQVPTGLPAVLGVARVPGPGGHLAALATATAAALGPLRGQVTAVVVQPTGLLAVVADGIQVRFGDATQLRAKAEAAAAVLAALEHPARYVDVSVPSAPVAG
jgi:hypothetical protein